MRDVMRDVVMRDVGKNGNLLHALPTEGENPNPGDPGARRNREEDNGGRERETRPQG